MAHGPIPIPPGGAGDQSFSSRIGTSWSALRRAGNPLFVDLRRGRYALLIVTTVVLGLLVETGAFGKIIYEIPGIRAIGRNADALQLAIAQKAAAEAETQKQVAINGSARQLAEQEEKTALAKKAAAEAETQRLVGLNAPQRASGEARKVDGEGVMSQARIPYAQEMAAAEV